MVVDSFLTNQFQLASTGFSLKFVIDFFGVLTNKRFNVFLSNPIIILLETAFDAINLMED